MGYRPAERRNEAQLGVQQTWLERTSQASLTAPYLGLRSPPGERLCPERSNRHNRRSKGFLPIEEGENLVRIEYTGYSVNIRWLSETLPPNEY